MIAFDYRLFRLINGLAGRSAALDSVMRLLAGDFFLPVILALAAFSLWFLGRNKEERRSNQWAFLYAVIGAGISSLVVDDIFDKLFYRPRPYFIIANTHVLLYRPSVSSFPAFDAVFAFAMAGGVALVNRPVGLAMGAGALLYGFARVYAGMHFPLDIAGGALLGLLTTWFTARVMNLGKPVFDWAFALLEQFHAA